MVLSQSERLRYIQEQATKFVSRNKCVDSSLMTQIVQAKASSVMTPKVVTGVQNSEYCGTVTGKGTNGEYINVLQTAEAAAIGAPCSNNPTDTGVNPHIILPTPCINFNAPPFTEQNLSTMYVAPCVNPGIRNYFPRIPSNGPGCTTTKITDSS